MPSVPEMTPESKESDAYRVLARKYRPTTFSGLIGQDVLVRTLTKAFESGRLAHAFILTGVRGVGKTTTARIVARALNCIGPDGKGEPTTEPCGVCVHCKSIADDRHVDILEMDAASRTGVDDIRELIEGVRYRPTSARYKVYIIDEVHMLSKNAFNALLKTLEEPPEHVKFIFATTEIRKVPVTVLSRCQRFDLRRVESEELALHFNAIATKEGATISETAVRLIARAADGSVRDGLSLLDQAISHADHEIGEAEVRDMLGLADRSQSFDIFEATLRGDAAGALEIVSQQYISGADPVQVMEDLLDITHWITRIKVSPEVANDVAVPEIERTRGRDLSDRLGMAAVSRAWQMLLKGLSEVRSAPSPIQAAEMVVIRLAHAATLPTPEEAMKILADSRSGASPAGSGASAGGGQSTGGNTSATTSTEVASGNGGSPHSGGGARAALSVVAADPETVPDQQPENAQVNHESETEPESEPQVFHDLASVAKRAGECREGRLQAYLMHNARPVRFESGTIELAREAHTDDLMVQRLRKFLLQETGINWVVGISGEAGDQTLAQRQAGETRDAIATAATHPLVQAVLETFPGAEVASVAHHQPADRVADPSDDDNNDDDQSPD
ncbi:MAG: DNA polymerase III subunit gamma/tau [Rhodospirillales bacterium]|nr:DNA polymerase III subunit gamma/tau [Rhodospirillales bacterium]